MKTEVFTNKSEAPIEHPELVITDLGVKSMYVEGRGSPRRLYGRHALVEGPESLVRSFLDKLAKETDLHTDL